MHIMKIFYTVENIYSISVKIRQKFTRVMMLFSLLTIVCVFFSSVFVCSQQPFFAGLIFVFENIDAK